MKKRGIILIFGLIILMVGCESYIKPTEELGKLFISYFRPGQQKDNLGKDNLDLINYDRYTHLIYFTAHANEDATIRMPEDSKEFAQKCIEGGTIPMFCFLKDYIKDDEGEDTNTHNFLYFHQKGLLDTFVTNAVDKMIDNGFQGIDMDWEHPVSVSEIIAWNELMKKLRLEMNKRTEETNTYYYLSTALPVWLHYAPTKDVVHNYVDFFNVMTYDQTGPWGSQAGNTCPVYPHPDDIRRSSAYNDLKSWIRNGYPPEKLVGGLAYYGYEFKGFEPFDTIYRDVDGNIKNGSAGNGAQYRYIVNLVNNESWTSEYHEESASNWYWSPDRDEFVACANEQVVVEYAKMAKELGIGGLFSWALSMDLLENEDGSYSNPLEKAAYDEWVKTE